MDSQYDKFRNKHQMIEFLIYYYYYKFLMKIIKDSEYTFF